jgi:5'-deoxynucleotidase
MSHNRLQDLLALSHVPRWGVVPTTRPQSVAEHSFRVAAIAMEICRALNGEQLPSATIIEYHVVLWAIIHDAPEAETGDLPSTVKGAFPGLKSIEMGACPWMNRMQAITHPLERAIVGVADKIEAILFIREWGVGPKARYAEERDTAILRERVEEARSKLGLAGLLDVVGLIIDSDSLPPEPKAEREKLQGQPPPLPL